MGGIQLSWSGYDTYRKCPSQYYRDRVSDETPPERDSRHFAIVGSVVQKTFEDFYEQRIWRSGKEAPRVLMGLAEKHHRDFLQENYVNFDHVTCNLTAKESLRECLEIVPKTLKAVVRERLWGRATRSEYPISVPLSNGRDGLRGKLDFVIQKDTEDGDELTILDGKSTKNVDRPDEDQLYFYALMYFMRFRRMPDRLGFLFYRYGDDPEKAIRWIPVDKHRLKWLRDDVLATIEKIRGESTWRPTPEPKNCRWCLWERVCAPRQAQKQKNREKRMSDEDLETEGYLKGVEADDEGTIGFPDLV